ncbi:MAG: cytidine deaminase [Clostridia bacterium]|nr:cytidine deaminase [Clostridia bacterium]
MNKNELVALALEARENSYSPYSGFKVGAALLTKNGRVYKGCNIENGAFSPTNCAERTAVFSAVSDGEKDFSAIAVVGGAEEINAFCPPCGVCRQVLSEFCNADFEIHLFNGEEIKTFTLGELLPEVFNL